MYCTNAYFINNHTAEMEGVGLKTACSWVVAIAYIAIIIAHHNVKCEVTLTCLTEACYHCHSVLCKQCQHLEGSSCGLDLHCAVSLSASLESVEYVHTCPCQVARVHVSMPGGTCIQRQEKQQQQAKFNVPTSLCRFSNSFLSCFSC